MAFVPVPKDLNRVKTKVMFNLTKRQLICFALAAAAGVPIFFLTKPSLGISTSAMLMVVIMLPFIFFALYEKDGQPAEKILGHVIKSMFLRDKCGHTARTTYTLRSSRKSKRRRNCRLHSSTKKAAEPKRLTKNGKVYGDLLSAEEKKKLVLQKKKDKKAKKVRKSAQQTIPYVEMCRDGICKVNSRLYTKTIRSTTSTISSPRTRTRRLSSRTGATF